MGFGQLLSCFCAGSPNQHELSIAHGLLGGCKLEPVEDGCVDVDPAEDLQRLQRELSALRGTGYARLTSLLKKVSLHANADASLFGVVDEGLLVLLATSHPDGVQNLVGLEPVPRQDLVLQKVMMTQRPALDELSTSETGSTLSGSGLGAVCAVPLFGGEAVAGALLLEASPLASLKCLLLEGVEQPTFLDQKQAANKKRARHRLFSSPSMLHQLGLAVSVGLGLDGEQLQWLARSLHRVATCDSMNSLVWELCEDVAAHIKRRFIVEAGAVRAALLPRADAQLGLLFHAQPCSSSHARGPSGRDWRPSPAADAGLGTGASQGLPRSVRSGLECGGAAPPTPTRVPRHHQSAGQVLMQPQCSKPGVLSSMASRNRLSTQAASSGAASSDCGTATSRLSKRPASTNLFGEPSAVSGRVMTLFGHAALGGRPTDPQHHLHTTAAAASPPPSRTTIVVQLPPHMAAEAPSASLHAQAFPLKHTALRALALAAADGGGDGDGVSRNISGTGGGGTFPGTCMEDVALYLQNVHNPSRDVCLLLGCMRGAAAPHGQPGSPRTPTTAPLSPLHPGGGALTGSSGAAAGTGGSGGAGALQSLVLVGLRLGNSVLAFYLCFPRRLPGELLEAVRASCDELLGEMFAGAVRAKLEGSLAAEFETLRTTTPGHFAVLRSATSVNGLLLQSHQRPGSQASGSLRATRLIAPPRAGCGLLQQAKTVSGFSNLSAATPGGGAATGGASVAEGGGPYASASKLSRHHSVELSCASQIEAVSLFTALCAARGSSLPRTVSFTTERGHGGGGGAGTAEAGSSMPPGQRQASRELAPAALSQEDLLSVLLQMRQSEAATGCCGSHGGDAARSASILTMTVAGVDAAAGGARQQLDLLVSSIHATMTTESNGAMVSFAEDLDSLELLSVLGKGGGGVVCKGRLGTQEVAVKVMELPDVNVGDTTQQLQQQLQTQGAGGRSLRSGPGAEADGAHTLTHAPNPAAAAAVAKEQLRARRALLRNAMEMAVQGRLSHPNLIQVYATYANVTVERRVREDGSTFHCLVPADAGVLDLGLPAPTTVYCAIVAELADCGSLATALSSRAFPRVVLVPRVAGVSADQHPFQLDMRGVYMTLLDVALALRHLHSLNLVHRDIKPANLLLKSNPRDHRGFTVKLADFGFVLHLSEVAEDGSRYVLVDQACGTVTHMAPELLPGKARVDASVDVYSFGILMWELVSGGVRPFPHLHPDNIPRHVYKGARPTFGDVVPLAYRGLAHACWSTDAHRRPKAADLVTMITAQMQECE
ncbi:hypothetical protein PLESTF_000424100 [Pleodorina starrii]|nr:hypothetical protein PLESTM_001461700 [Pleodorina starrii]GLC66407.1 hypothetical protein PLESTF_000424100 [Pleodorina starrii]